MRALPLLLACLLITGCMGREDGDDVTPTPTPTAGTPTPSPTPATPTNATPTPPTNATPTPPTNVTPTTPTTPANNTTAPAPVNITIAGFAFSPQTKTVPVGTNVTWTNNEAVPTVQHTATADDASFDSGNLAVGAAYSFVFNTTGTFTYKCDLHPVMTGTITVQ